MSEEMKVGTLKRILENCSDDDTIRFERRSGTFLPYMEYEPWEQWFEDENHILVMSFVEINDEKLEKRMKAQDVREEEKERNKKHKISNL